MNQIGDDKMSSKVFLTISSIIGVLYALGFLIVPEVMARIYGVDANPSAILEVRFFGATLLGLGLIFWVLRGTEDRAVLKSILTGFAISAAVGAGVATWGTYTGIMSQVGWSVTVIYALLFIGSLVARPK